MNTIDIRTNGKPLPIERIVFADDEGYGNTPAFIQSEDGTLYFGNDDDEYLSEFTPEDGLNLLKALQKAQELGWIPKPVVEAPKAPVARKATTATKK